MQNPSTSNISHFRPCFSSFVCRFKHLQNGHQRTSTFSTGTYSKGLSSYARAGGEEKRDVNPPTLSSAVVTDSAAGSSCVSCHRRSSLYKKKKACPLPHIDRKLPYPTHITCYGRAGRAHVYSLRESKAHTYVCITHIYK